MFSPPFETYSFHSTIKKQPCIYIIDPLKDKQPPGETGG
jgi:hypothetical protein